MVISENKKAHLPANIVEYYWVLPRTPLKHGHDYKVRRDILTLFLFRETFSLSLLSIILVTCFL